MQVIIIDNTLEETLRLEGYLTEAFPSASILPKHNSERLPIFNKWSEVQHYLLPINDDSVIICLDLALESEKVNYSDVKDGLDQGAAIRQLKPDWVIVAYTMHGMRATLSPKYKEAFNGLIDKAILDSYTERDDCVLYVKNAINAAIRKLTLEKGQDVFPNNVQIIDSLGMRSFRAVFGDSALAEVIENEASQCNLIRIKALTSGHSGAFLLSIRGRTDEGGPLSLAIKVARDDKTIQDEIDAPSKYKHQLGPLNGHLGFFDTKKKQFSSIKGVYYCQALEKGKQLLELLLSNDKDANLKTLAPITRLCIDVCKSDPPSKCGIAPAHEKFKLLPIDISRLETSVDFLSSFGNTLLDHGIWPSSISNPVEISKELIDLAKNWSECVITKVMLKTVLQHGDLNPGNILIRQGEDGFPVLIDLSRLGQWPIGYDLSRLALLLRIRLLAASGNSDWLPDGIKNWLYESVTRFDRNYTSNNVLCAEAQYCDDHFRQFCEGLPIQYKRLFMYSYKLGTLWDLIKIISYQDISPFKRIWAFIESWKLKNQLNIEYVDLSRELE
jgi:Phosphotransferase enzyme family